VNHSSNVEGTLSTLSHQSADAAPATVIADELVLLIDCDRPQSGSARHRLDGIHEVRIGRGSARLARRSGRCLELTLGDARVSTVHATLSRAGAAWTVADAGSKNGVLVNGARIERQLLRDGDIVELGRTFFRYRVARARPAGEPLDVTSHEGFAAETGLCTFHEPLARQLRTLTAVAASNLPVLILGASGTGKELVARAVHRLGQRPGAYVGVNCGALPETLVEAELFGARRGAFTGATEDRPGLVRASHQGTLFLDEVGELPARAQATLLRVLQEREVLAVGATRAVPVDLRLVSATHRDLQSLVAGQQFRADLLARLAGVTLELPPLRDRLDDFGILLSTLLLRHAPAGAQPATVDPAALRLLLRHGWPLNVRELEHALRGALALSPGRIEVEHLPMTVRVTGEAPAPELRATAAERQWTPAQLARRDELRTLLATHGGSISEVARQMGKDRVQIRRWIRMFAIDLHATAGA
jgi:DNA-binding NtrC family response regulator